MKNCFKGGRCCKIPDNIHSEILNQFLWNLSDFLQHLLQREIQIRENMFHSSYGIAK